MNFLHWIDKGIKAFIACLPRKKPLPCFNQQAAIIAHRGVHGRRISIENTEEAFAHALRLGCFGIELDVQCTKDNNLVVNHDLSLKRLWGKDKLISELTWQELQIQAPLVPLLSEVIERYGKKIHLFIELKAPFKAEKKLFEIMQSLTPVIDYHLISLDEPLLACLLEIPRAAMLLVAGHNNSAQLTALSIQKQYGGVLGHYLLFNDACIKKLVAAEQKTGVGIVDSTFGLYRELNRGIPWVFTDKAIKLCAVLKKLQQS